jgi:hypothetical protein
MGSALKAPDAVAHVFEGGDEGCFLFEVGAFDVARILDAPMRIGRMAEPDRAGFTRRVVTDDPYIQTNGYK